MHDNKQSVAPYNENPMSTISNTEYNVNITFGFETHHINSIFRVRYSDLGLIPNLAFSD